MKNTILYFTVIIAILSSVQAYFYVPSFMNKLPFKSSMAYAQHENSLYLFGGENGTTRYTNEFFKLTQTSTSYEWEVVPQKNTAVPSSYSRAVFNSDGSKYTVFGGITDLTSSTILPMQIQTFDFTTQLWTQSSDNTTNVTINSTFINRSYFSVSRDPQRKITYIYGGVIQTSQLIRPLKDLYAVDDDLKVTVLASTSLERFGHVAHVLSNGKLVVLGGNVVESGNSRLAETKSVWIYDPDQNSWVVQNLNGVNGAFPSIHTDASSVITSDDKIIIFGGSNGLAQRYRVFLNTIAILDTKTWSWSIPQIEGIPPARRSHATAAILSEGYLTIAFGSGNNLFYNEINSLDLSTNTWLQSFDDRNKSGDGSISKGLIAGVTIAAVVLLIIILFLLWKFQSYIRWLIVHIHNDIWKPRTGEPVWAETSRIVSQLFFLFIFIMFLYFVIRQAIESPNVTQRIEYSTAQVAVPDVRFCFDGFPLNPTAANANGVTCNTEIGKSCSTYVQKLNMSIFQPTFADNLGPVDCYLFRAPEDFKLTSTSGSNNGSRLLFTLWGDQAYTSGRVHVSVFPKNMDPNALIYGLSDNISNYLSEADVLRWQNAERNDLQATNIFTLEPFTYNALSYSIIDHRYLQPVGWNYVGFLPVTNSTPQIESNFRAESPNPLYTTTHQDLGLLAVFPEEFAQLIDREVKMYTLVNALGFVGGIFGILVAVQTWLFGYRPRSPWGVIHRWSTGSRKESLLTGLQQKFKTTESGIPLVHPVHHRFSMNQFDSLGHETNEQRVSRVEERMQVLELLFKAYYVNDEVFRSLDNASALNKNNNNFSNTVAPHNYRSESVGTNTPNPFIPQTEKLSPYHKEDQNGFSHMFNEGHSLSSDTNSQQHLNDTDIHLNNLR